MDTDFNLVETLIDNTLTQSHMPWRCNAQFVKGGYLYQIGNEVRRFSSHDRRHQQVLYHGSVLAVSHDRKRAALLSRDASEYSFLLYDAESGQKAALPVSGEIWNALFSLDDRILAYTKRTDNFNNDIDLYLLDLDSGERWFTGVRIAGELAVWTDLPMPPAKQN